MTLSLILAINIAYFSVMLLVARRTYGRLRREHMDHLLTQPSRTYSQALEHYAKHCHRVDLQDAVTAGVIWLPGMVIGYGIVTPARFLGRAITESTRLSEAEREARIRELEAASAEPPALPQGPACASPGIGDSSHPVPVNEPGTIGAMKPGDVRYTLPWALQRDCDGRGWLRSDYPAEDDPGGTVRMQVYRHKYGWYEVWPESGYGTGSRSHLYDLPVTVKGHWPRERKS